MDPTNKAIMPDLDAFFLNQGKGIGYDPTDAEIALATAVLKPVLTKKYMQMYGLEAPTNVTTYNTATNEVTGSVYEVGRNAKGQIMERIRPETIQTTEGFQYIVGPGQTRSYINRDTGNTPKGYVGAGNIYSQTQSVIGVDNNAARDAASAATGSNANKPVVPYTLTNSAGRVMTFTDPYQVRAAFKRDELTQDEARRAASHFPLPQQPNR